MFPEFRTTSIQRSFIEKFTKYHLFGRLLYTNLLPRSFNTGEYLEKKDQCSAPSTVGVPLLVHVIAVASQEMIRKRPARIQKPNDDVTQRLFCHQIGVTLFTFTLLQAPKYQTSSFLFYRIVNQVIKINKKRLELAQITNI